jgi:hypothetical protein
MTLWPSCPGKRGGACRSSKSDAAGHQWDINSAAAEIVSNPIIPTSFRSPKNASGESRVCTIRPMQGAFLGFLCSSPPRITRPSSSHPPPETPARKPAQSPPQRDGLPPLPPSSRIVSRSVLPVSANHPGGPTPFLRIGPLPNRSPPADPSHSPPDQPNQQTTNIIKLSAHRIQGKNYHLFLINPRQICP